MNAAASKTKLRRPASPRRAAAPPPALTYEAECAREAAARGVPVEWIRIKYRNVAGQSVRIVCIFDPALIARLASETRLMEFAVACAKMAQQRTSTESDGRQSPHIAVITAAHADRCPSPFQKTAGKRSKVKV